MPLAPLTSKEILGSGVSVKEEFNEDVTEEIKGEPFEYEYEVINKVCNVNVIHEVIYFMIFDLRHEANAKVSCNLVKGLGEPYSCETCNTAISGKHNLRENHTAVKFGDKTFSRKSSRGETHESHTKKKCITVKFCKKTFPERKRPFSLRICEYIEEKTYTAVIFVRKTFHIEVVCIRSHMRLHTNEKPYSCEICNKGFHRKTIY
ncbi:zinc finger protein 39-like [Penaeus monodon]|uniref:zinc finger protein 39-like n=1 Tax=Penaeus monodon TaxID=6687 RepID=UPI0018A7780F|nr:zinc finger protein 39-like [Penaeus monodon]